MTTSTAPHHDVVDIGLADVGARRVEWAGREMPVLAGIRKRLAKERPFAGLRIAACLHVTTETANLAIALRDAGASVALCASNPLSTQDDAAAALVAIEGIAVFARKGEDRDTYYRHINAVLETKPQITMDDGADVVTLLHTERKDLLQHVKGGTEETGRARLSDRRGERGADQAHVRQPVRHGSIRGRRHPARDEHPARRQDRRRGRVWLGRPRRRIALPRYGSNRDHRRGRPAPRARGDLFITCTGNVNVIAAKHFEHMKDGAILANAGHFNDEIELDALAKQARSMREIRRFVDEYDLGDRKIFVLGEGRLINHVAAEANPAAVMDMSFANQALAIEYLVRNAGRLAPQVYPVPRELDEQISRAKLEAMGMRIDKMTEEQAIYAKSWKAGT